MNRVGKLVLYGALASVAAMASAQAEVINITYVANSLTNGITAASGTGTVTFTPNASTPGSVATSDVTNFSFTLNETDTTGSQTITYAFADLLSFSATLSGSGSVTNLALYTGNQGTGSLPNQSLEFGMVLPPPSNTAVPDGTYLVDGPPPGTTITTGTVSASDSPVPEPASLGLLGLGLAGLGFVRRRRG